MSWVLALSLLCLLLVALAWCGTVREESAFWRLLVIAAGITVAVQSISGLGVMLEPYRLQYWNLNWLAVAGAVFLCVRGLLWKLWI